MTAATTAGSAPTDRRRRFPAPGWAWPSASRDLLLRAALLPDPDAARAALRTWLAGHDLDNIVFADHRLMAAISERHGSSLADLREYPRMKGLQRQLWTRSRLRLNAALPVLRALADAGIPIMLLKGAARIALDPGAQRLRSQQDVDILVRSEQMSLAAQVLTAAGWQTVRGDTPLSAVARAPGTRAINFQLPPWGDVDLHRCAYHGTQRHDQLDARLWVDARPAQFFDLPVLVPCAAEGLAMCLSHGAWSPEAHSDWLVDAAEIIAGGRVDWDRACEIFTLRRMVTQARIGLGYLHSALGIDLGADAMAKLSALRPEGRLIRAGTLLGARPEEELRRWQRLLRRAWFVYARSRQARPPKGAVPPLSLSVARRHRRARALPDAGATIVPLRAPATAAPGTVTDFHAEVIFDSPGLARRMEFELNSPEENLARFRVFVLRGSEGPLRARLHARIRLPAGTSALTLESRPGKYLYPNEEDAKVRKYAAIPFRLAGSSLDAGDQASIRPRAGAKGR